MEDNNQTTNLSGNIPQNNVQQGYQTQTDVTNVTSVSGLVINPNSASPIVGGTTQQNVGVPYTPENPVNSGVVTNNVATQPTNVQQVVQQQVNTQAQAQVVQQTTTQPVYQDNTFTNAQQIPNNLQQAQAPVVPTEQTQITTQPGDTNVTLGSPVQTDQNVQTVAQVVSTEQVPQATREVAQQGVENVPQETQTAKPIMKQKEPVQQKGIPYTYTVDTDLMIEFAQRAKYAAIGEALAIKTTVIQLTFSPNGLQMVATDSTNILIQRDTMTKYIDTASICVKADLFVKLIQKLKTDTIDIVYNSQQESIKIISNGEFILQNIMDAQVGKPIEFDLTSSDILPTDVVYNLDANNLKENLTKVSAAAEKGAPNAVLSGVYFSDRMYATNRSIFIGVPTEQTLQQESFYLGAKFVDIVSNIKFNKPEECKLAFRKNANGKPTYLILTDGDITLCGPSSENLDDYPVNNLLTLLGVQCEKEFTCDKTRIVDVLEIAKLFIQNNSDSEFCYYHLDGPNKLMTITTYDGSTTQDVTIDGNIPDVLNFKIGITNFQKALSVWDVDTLRIKYSGNEPQFFEIVNEDSIELISFG